MKHIAFVTDFDRVTGIVAALKTHHHIHITGQYVNQFTLTFVTPLGAHQNIYRHLKKLLFVII